MRNGVSVVLCCYNSAGRISGVLENLSKQKFTKHVDWEIVLVDNDSDDNTSELAASLWSNTEVPMHVIQESEKGLSHARRTGIQQCAYNFVSFIDDDNWVNENWIERVYDNMENNPRVGVMGGKGEAVFENSAPGWFPLFEQSFAVGTQSERTGVQDKDIVHLYGAGLTIRKDAWEGIIAKGFEFLLSGRKGKLLSSGEDSEMCLAMRMSGYDLFYDPELTFKHYMPSGRLTIPYLMKLAGSFGRAAVIIDMYKSIYREFRGFKKKAVESYPCSLVSSCYNILLIMPDYLKSILTGRNILEARFRLTFHWNNLLCKLNMGKTYRQYLELVKRGAWNVR